MSIFLSSPKKKKKNRSQHTDLYSLRLTYSVYLSFPG
nr:MAG TPA: hypothetical protein [Caudoviricetes sp.]